MILGRWLDNRESWHMRRHWRLNGTKVVVTGGRDGQWGVQHVVFGLWHILMAHGGCWQLVWQY